MSLPTDPNLNPSTWFFESNPNYANIIIRSKDRSSGTPNSFTIPIPQTIPSEYATGAWIRVKSVSLAPNPNPKDILNMPSISGNYNQPNVDAIPYTFDVGCGIDLCVESLNATQQFDSDPNENEYYFTSAPVSGASNQTSITVPIANKTGICFSGNHYASPLTPYVGDLATIPGVVAAGTATPATLQVIGFTSTGVVFGVYPNIGVSAATWSTIAVGTEVSITHAQAMKDNTKQATLAFIPYTKGETKVKETTWMTLGNLEQNMTIKLFSDKGYPLKLKKQTALVETDLNDVNIDDWVLELGLFFTVSGHH